MTIQERVSAVREWMREQGISAFVVPTIDPHNSEYVPAHWQCREWLTGFTGSAGTAVVTLTDARLWTDSRYWLQATAQLEGTPFTLMREDVDPSIEEWLSNDNFPAVNGGVYGGGGNSGEPPYYYNPRHLPDPFDLWWEDRPAFPLSEAWIMPDEIAGESAASKIQRLTEWMQQEGLESYLVEELADVAWLLNLRGDDIPYNPFLISFFEARLSGPHTLYINKEQITPEVAAYLDRLHVVIVPYEQAPVFYSAANPQGLPPEGEVAAGRKGTIEAWRSLKNPTEQQGFRRAHELDGVAMVRFLRWLDERTEPFTEVDVDTVLTQFRAECPEFIGLSFGTIAAYGPNAAIVHYEAEPATAATIHPQGMLLLDSGAHYRCGTTDITRTIALGPLTEEERKVYTLVLKGHLQLQNLRFPEGTTGLQLDTVARMAMWREGYDFGHGTGHGVGHVLGVHEGPCQIRKNKRDCTLLPFQAGQTITNEPGIYIEGRFGVRIENVLLSREGSESSGGSKGSKWLEWEPLTLCPYDLRPVVVEMLTPEERQWLNAYHQLVRDRLLPQLPTEADRQWLIAHTTPL